MASIKQTGENAYQITVSCGYDSSGKKIRKKTTFKPELFTSKGNRKSEKAVEKEVAAFAADFEKKVLTGHYAEGHTMTFEVYSKKYMEEYALINQAPLTLESTTAAIKLFNAEFGYMTLESLNPLFLQHYINAMLQAPKASGKPGTLSQGTVKRRAAVLSAMLSQAVRWNLIESNPMDRVQVKKNDSPEEKLQFFTQEQAEAFLSALDEPLYYQYGTRKRTDSKGNLYEIEGYQAARTTQSQLKLFFYMAMFTGCRRGELIALTWDDLNLQESSISITKSTCRVKGQIITKTTKTKKSARTIVVPAVVMELARKWKAEQARQHLLIGTQWQGENHIFIQWNGKQMGLETPYQAFHRIINNYNVNRSPDAPELPLIPLHGLRHTAATLLIGSGINIRTVSGRLGHSNPSTTLNIYSHALTELDRKASDALANALIKKA